jgi:pimeloyl-ACP methyl ester carboxylesterase
LPVLEARKIDGPFGPLAVWDTGGDGPAIVLLHGNSSSSRVYWRQLDGPLGRIRRLVAYDLQGHGDSARSDDPAAYLLPGHAKSLLALVDEMGLEEATFAGWSLGGHVVLEAAPDLARARGFAIFGTPPVDFPAPIDRAFLPNPLLGVSFSAEISREQAEGYVQAGFAPGFTDIPPFFVEDVLRTDGRARAGVAASIDPAVSRDEIAVVANLKAPLAILHGERDQLVNSAYFASLKTPTLWRGAVQTIAHAGHTPQWETPAAFDSLIEAFTQRRG